MGGGLLGGAEPFRLAICTKHSISRLRGRLLLCHRRLGSLHLGIEHALYLAALIRQALVPPAVGLGLAGKVAHAVAQLALFHIL